MMIQLPKEFRVQIVLSNDVLNELDAEAPTQEQLLRHQMLYESNTFKLKPSMFMEKRKPGRPPKQKPVVLEPPPPPPPPPPPESDEEEDEEDVPEDDFEGMEVENEFNLSAASSGKEKKLTKRQLHSMGNLEHEPLLSLPQQRSKSKKELSFTEEEMMMRMMKETQRKQKLYQQQEEIKQQTVHKILNEVGRKQRQRQAQEYKKIEETHKYRTLPPTDSFIKYKSSCAETIIVTSSPFASILQNSQPPKPAQKRNCTNCNQQVGRYKIPKTEKSACSLECYKLLMAS